MAKIDPPPRAKNNLAAYQRPEPSAVQKKTAARHASKRQVSGGAKSKVPLDHVTLSSEARRLQAIADELQSLSSQSERDQKVEALRRAVKEGRYRVDAAKVAERMLRSLSDDSE
jgi:flagellar biosynthesis anti-sigma factor FlgM